MSTRAVVAGGAMVAAMTLAGCAEKSAPGPAASSVAPTASASTQAAPLIPAPTKVDEQAVTGMRTFHWDPPVAVPGEDIKGRALTVLTSTTMQQLLGVDPAKDGFQHYQTTKDHKVVFIQTLAWQGQTLPVHRAMATVELVDGAKLAYVGTGFRKGVSLPAGQLTVDQQQAGEIAIEEYRRIEQAPGKVTPHRHPGLTVYRALGGIHVVGYDIHVERQTGDGQRRPYLILVDAQTGKVVRSKKSWVE